MVAAALLPFANWFYQKRADDYADEMWVGNQTEYNRQIKGNAYRYLINRFIWGLLFLSGFIWNFKTVIAQGFRWISLLALAMAIGCFVWGIYGYRNELKKLKVETNL